jgi:hypothetical protein
VSDGGEELPGLASRDLAVHWAVPGNGRMPGIVPSAAVTEERFVTLAVGNIPREPPGYQPQADLLAELDEAAGGDPVVHVLAGTSAAGKTQVAAGYARAVLARDWQLVAWIDSGNVSTLLAGLAAVADAVNLPVADAGRRLIVFDNAGDPDGLRSFVPAGTAHVVITSDGQPMTSLGTSVRVNAFTTEEALAFLTRRTGLPEIWVLRCMMFLFGGRERRGAGAIGLLRAG